VFLFFFLRKLQVGYVLCSNCKVFKCVTFPNFEDSQNWIDQQLSFSQFHAIVITLVSNKDRFSCLLAFFTPALVHLLRVQFCFFQRNQFYFLVKKLRKEMIQCFTVISFLYFMDYCKWCDSKNCKSWTLIMLCVLDAHCNFFFLFGFRFLYWKWGPDLIVLQSHPIHF